ncbi:GNAT family N-acetyltransferase [Desertivirga xinjiangensis]|uniref:GNAT family N-acetyltransferase n=1 Tax=Desertivirga xinjiangensis TaxID=539206 RepID=UPI00210BB52E|nr:GNAT family N-acetyltransferase [Pedobacter xinjiangensis]
MIDIKFETGRSDTDAFNLYESGTKVGEMIVKIKDTKMIVYHTEVDEDKEGNGFATMLLHEMVTFVRANKLRVVPLCVFVRARFEAQPDQYGDVWEKSD